MTASREFRYTVDGEPIDISEWAKQTVDVMPPLSETQRARIRALFEVGDDPAGGRS